MRPKTMGFAWAQPISDCGLILLEIVIAAYQILAR
jgi:hypothetical protein